MNTHELDGKLIEQIPFLIDRNTTISREKLIESQMYQDYVDKYAIHQNLLTILQDYNTIRNYDSTNNYSCEMIFYKLDKIYNSLNQMKPVENDNNAGDKNLDFLDLLHQQLNEMTSGMCPQGRTHRLLYIVFTFS